MLQVLPMRTLASYLRRYASETYVDAMNRDPNVVTKGLGERMVKPATEILWAGFFLFSRWRKTSRGGKDHESNENTLPRGRRSRSDRIYLGRCARRPGILDGSERYAGWTKFGPS